MTPPPRTFSGLQERFRDRALQRSPTPPPHLSPEREDPFAALQSRMQGLRQGSEPRRSPFPLEKYERGHQLMRRRAPRPRRPTRRGNISYRSLRSHRPGTTARGARRKSRRKGSKSHKRKHHRARKSKRKKSFRRRRSSKR